MKQQEILATKNKRFHGIWSFVDIFFNINCNTLDFHSTGYKYVNKRLKSRVYHRNLIQKLNVAVLKLMIWCSFNLIYGEYLWMRNCELAFRLLINKASQFAYQTFCCWQMLIGLVFERTMPMGCKSCISSVLLGCNKRAHYAFLMHFCSYEDKFGSLFTFSFGRG